MSKYNRKCFYCGEEYYCCSSCVSINSWKNTHCSIKCFLNSQKENKQNIKPIIINKGESFMKAVIKKNKKTIRITGYDLDLGKFDCADNETRILEDFDYFILLPSELENINSKKKQIKKTNLTKLSETIDDD